MKKKSYPLAKVYCLLESGPVVLITPSRKGVPNIMTQSWHTMMEFVPPLVAVQNWLEQEQLQTRLIMQVHDELVLEVPDSELMLVKEKLPELMCNVAELKVPLEVGLGVGMNWEAAH